MSDAEFEAMKADGVRSAFEKDTLYRLIVEAARLWCVGRFLASGNLPVSGEYYVYADGPRGLDWGNPPGPAKDAPLRGKRIAVTFTVEDWPKAD